MKVHTSSGRTEYLIDVEDLKLISQYNTSTDSDGYIVIYPRNSGHHPKKQLLHRFLLNAPKGVLVDHRDLNRLNYQRDNLRICTRTQNNQNTRKAKIKNATSKYKGVRWHPGDEMWNARIQVEKKAVWLGNFSTEVAAAEKYDDAAAHYFQEFANFNFPTRAREPFQLPPPLKRHSKHRGISFDKTKRNNPWTAYSQKQGVRWQERFQTEAEALAALQRFLRASD